MNSPAYVAYQGDGDVTAPLVYVNYGMKEDYDTLERLGVSVKGKIAIARYGAGWRGLKPKLAQEHGAVGCIIYSDPRDDGYTVEDAYPKGPARPPQGFQRGSVADMTHLSRRSADARHGRDGKRAAAGDQGFAGDPENSRAADFVCRCAAFSGGAGRPRGAAAMARLASDHLSRRRQKQRKRISR